MKKTGPLPEIRPQPKKQIKKYEKASQTFQVIQKIQPQKPKAPVQSERVIPSDTTQTIDSVTRPWDFGSIKGLKKDKNGNKRLSHPSLHILKMTNTRVSKSTNFATLPGSLPGSTNSSIKNTFTQFATFGEILKSKDLPLSPPSPFSSLNHNKIEQIKYQNVNYLSKLEQGYYQAVTHEKKKLKINLRRE